jgi:hypothetical protein
MTRNRKNVDKQGGTNGPPNRDVNAATRSALAVSLRAQKLTYEEIAQRSGYSNASACRKAIMRELDRCVVKNVEELRAEEMNSLEQLERECWKRLYDKNYEKSMLFSVDRILMIKERRAKLMGLDIPRDSNENIAQVVIREVPAGLLPMPLPVVEGSNG